MAEIKKVWIVVDASPEATIEDVLFEADFSKLADYMRGIPRGTWEDEHTSVYLNENEATTEAKKRLKKTTKTASVETYQRA